MIHVPKETPLDYYIKKALIATSILVALLPSYQIYNFLDGGFMCKVKEDWKSTFISSLWCV